MRNTNIDPTEVCSTARPAYVQKIHVFPRMFFLDLPFQRPFGAALYLERVSSATEMPDLITEHISATCWRQSLFQLAPLSFLCLAFCSFTPWPYGHLHQIR